jgi:hypothetical protein
MEIPTGYAAVQMPLAHTGFPRTAMLTWGVQDVGPSANPGALANTIFTPFNTRFQSLFDTDVTYGPVRVRVNYGSGPVDGVGTSVASGTAVINSSPANVAVLVKKVSALTPGRKGRGRFYWPWFVDDTVVDELGFLQAGYVSGHQTVFNSWLGDNIAANVPLVILHNTAGTPASVTSLIVENQVGTQRRRLGR